jgi:hypothetical protein
MARIDDFKQAKAISIEELTQKDPEFIAQTSGADIKKENNEKGTLSLKFLNRNIIISWPDMEFFYDNSEKDISLQQQVLLLHYLTGCCSSGISKNDGEWISFQDVPDGRFYMDAFIKRAKDPLMKSFGQNPKRLIELTLKAYNAAPIDIGDFSVIVKALPLIPVALVLWEGDDEFPPEGNILFDKTVQSILSAEDIATLAGMVVYPLMGMV